MSVPLPIALFPALALTLLLGGCGVDGAPIPPDDREQPKPGLTLSGNVQMGVAGGSDIDTQMVTRITD